MRTGCGRDAFQRVPVTFTGPRLLDPQTIIFVYGEDSTSDEIVAICLPWDTNVPTPPDVVHLPPKIVPIPWYNKECCVCLESSKYGDESLEFACGHQICWGCTQILAATQSPMHSSRMAHLICPLCRDEDLSCGDYFNCGMGNIDLFEVYYTCHGAHHQNMCALASLSLPPHVTNAHTIQVETIWKQEGGWQPPYDTLPPHQDMFTAAKRAFQTDYVKSISQIRNNLRKRCAVCGKVDATNRCSRCQVEIYCSRECQKIAWKHGHKAVCASK